MIVRYSPRERQEGSALHAITIQIKIEDGNNHFLRNIHYFPEITSIKLPKNHHIAPEKFCNKCCEILKNYEIPFPIIPLYNDTLNLTYGPATTLMSGVLFPKNYVHQEKFPHLKSLLGHELAHKYLHTPYLENCKIAYYKNEVKILTFQKLMLSSIAASGLIKLTGIASLIPFTWFSPVMLTAIASYIGSAYYHATLARPLRTNEFKCDAMAIDIFGRTTEEKIHQCKKGINNFLSILKKLSFEELISQLLDMIYKSDAHPNLIKRIKALEKIKCDLEKISKADNSK